MLLENDALDFTNKAMKNGTEVSAFQKVKLGAMETELHSGTMEVKSFVTSYTKRFYSLKMSNSMRRTDVSSSEVKWEVDLSKSIEADIIPVLEKQWKKKQKALQRQTREQMLLNEYDEEKDGDRNGARVRNEENILLVHKPKGSPFRTAGVQENHKKLEQRGVKVTPAFVAAVLSSTWNDWEVAFSRSRSCFGCKMRDEGRRVRSDE
ncbi:hypothetical protein BUALT_Bualt04G0090500 [Buddleja alternifolia]|uniref:Uncharacterized protein n=1 Tax=Buddleja alternifolia TaxID=168488 RepID=A0AAV6XVJ4_9LAMI|nr:hypothetical protein BUALT_Bualt04G0090500 [Buddleja alternifolia]